jgi:hypothetical protein
LEFSEITSGRESLAVASSLPREFACQRFVLPAVPQVSQHEKKNNGKRNDPACDTFAIRILSLDFFPRLLPECYDGA